jgi:hypothetical protein
MLQMQSAMRAQQYRIQASKKGAITVLVGGFLLGMLGGIMAGLQLVRP